MSEKIREFLNKIYTEYKDTPKRTEDDINLLIALCRKLLESNEFYADKANLTSDEIILEYLKQNRDFVNELGTKARHAIKECEALITDQEKE